ncbi:MAG: hypothetical protein HZB10_00560 [Candidatus Yonathbacteria bacterium]|nr:hypothetical protein [Candidatus Yonathbacteria bacterium]
MRILRNRLKPAVFSCTIRVHCVGGGILAHQPEEESSEELSATAEAGLPYKLVCNCCGRLFVSDQSHMATMAGGGMLQLTSYCENGILRKGSF